MLTRFVAWLRANWQRFAGPAAVACFLALLMVNPAFAQFDPDAPTTADLFSDIFDSTTTMFPWWQIGSIVALITGFAMRIVPRLIKRMG